MGEDIRTLEPLFPSRQWWNGGYGAPSSQLLILGTFSVTFSKKKKKIIAYFIRPGEIG